MSISNKLELMDEIREHNETAAIRFERLQNIKNSLITGIALLIAVGAPVIGAIIERMVLV